MSFGLTPNLAPVGTLRSILAPFCLAHTSCRLKMIQSPCVVLLICGYSYSLTHHYDWTWRRTQSYGPGVHIRPEL